MNYSIGTFKVHYISFHYHSVRKNGDMLADKDSIS